MFPRDRFDVMNQRIKIPCAFQDHISNRMSIYIRGKEVGTVVSRRLGLSADYLPAPSVSSALQERR